MNNNTAIPFLDLITPHAELETELMEVVKGVLKTAAFIGGPMVENFEKAFAEVCETQHSVGGNNGNDAPRFSLIAARVWSRGVVGAGAYPIFAPAEAIS